MQAPDMTINLNSDWYGPADSQELAERLRIGTGLRVESGVFAFYHEGHPFPPEVIVSFLYTLLPLQDIYANLLSSMLWEVAKAANERLGREGSRVTMPRRARPMRALTAGPQKDRR